MKLKVKFKELEELKKKIKAKDSDWMLDNVTLFDLELYEGKEISSLNEVENYEGLLTYQGKTDHAFILETQGNLKRKYQIQKKLQNFMWRTVKH